MGAHQDRAEAVEQDQQLRAGTGGVFIQDFSAKCPDFSAKRKIFLQIHRNTLENSKVHPIRRLACRTETYPILETLLFLFSTRRFGGVGAPGGREKVPDHIFLQIKKKLCFWRKIMELTGFFCKIVYLAEDYGWMTTGFFCKICANWVANL
jgi:hypothetical protein